MFKGVFGRTIGKRTTRLRHSALTLVAALCLTTFAASAAHATEGGGGAYPNGAEDFLSGAVPPPGTYFVNYFDYYSADKLADNDGNANPLVPGFKLKVTADVLRFIHITNKQILGGFWGVHAFVPLVNVDVETRAGLGSDSKFGLGDIIVDPFILSWHGKNWHAATGIDIYIPTGSYDENDLANVGRNYWTFEPIVAATFLTDNGCEASVKMMYDINTENKDASLLTPPGTTEYLSGQEFHLDYALSKKISNFTLGVTGYYYQQVTDDEANGVEIGNRGRVVAVGPGVKYDYKNMMVSLKYQFETAAKNRPEGDNLWFKFVYAF